MASTNSGDRTRLDWQEPWQRGRRGKEDQSSGMVERSGTAPLAIEPQLAPLSRAVLPAEAISLSSSPLSPSPRPVADQPFGGRSDNDTNSPTSQSAYALAPSPAGVVSVLEQKLSALSRRTAAELKRTEREHSDLAKRLEAVEDLCRQQLGGLDARLGQMVREEAGSEAERAAQRSRARFDRDLQQLSEGLQHSFRDMQLMQEQTSNSIATLAKQADAAHDGLDELRFWRGKVQAQLETHDSQFDAQLEANTERFTIASDRVDKLQAHIEVVLGRERKQAQERLRSSCAELTDHLNELRRELLEQRNVADQMAVSMREVADNVALQSNYFEGQIAELGGALASRLQAKIAWITQELGKKVEGVSRQNQLEESLQALKDRASSLETSSLWLKERVQSLGPELHSELEALILESKQANDDVAKEEARTVHLEVMSVDTRIAAIEERLAADPSRRRCDAFLSKRAEKSISDAEFPPFRNRDPTLLKSLGSEVYSNGVGLDLIGGSAS